MSYFVTTKAADEFSIVDFDSIAYIQAKTVNVHSNEILAIYVHFKGIDKPIVVPGADGANLLNQYVSYKNDTTNK